MDIRALSAENVEIISGDHYLTIQRGSTKVMIPNSDVPKEGVSLKWAEEELDKWIKAITELNVNSC